MNEEEMNIVNQVRTKVNQIHCNNRSRRNMRDEVLDILDEVVDEN